MRKKKSTNKETKLNKTNMTERVRVEYNLIDERWVHFKISFRQQEMENEEKEEDREKEE